MNTALIITIIVFTIIIIAVTVGIIYYIEYKNVKMKRDFDLGTTTFDSGRTLGSTSRSTSIFNSNFGDPYYEYNYDVQLNVLSYYFKLRKYKIVIYHYNETHDFYYSLRDRDVINVNQIRHFSVKNSKIEPNNDVNYKVSFELHPLERYDDEVDELILNEVQDEYTMLYDTTTNKFKIGIHESVDFFGNLTTAVNGNTLVFDGSHFVPDISRFDLDFGPYNKSNMFGTEYFSFNKTANRFEIVDSTHNNCWTYQGVSSGNVDPGDGNFKFSYEPTFDKLTFYFSDKILGGVSNTIGLQTLIQFVKNNPNYILPIKLELTFCVAVNHKKYFTLVLDKDLLYNTPAPLSSNYFSFRHTKGQSIFISGDLTIGEVYQLDSVIVIHEKLSGNEIIYDGFFRQGDSSFDGGLIAKIPNGLEFNVNKKDMNGKTINLESVYKKSKIIIVNEVTLPGFPPITANVTRVIFDGSGKYTVYVDVDLTPMTTAASPFFLISIIAHPKRTHKLSSYYDYLDSATFLSPRSSYGSFSVDLSTFTLYVDRFSKEQINVSTETGFLDFIPTIPTVLQHDYTFRIVEKDGNSASFEFIGNYTYNSGPPSYYSIKYANTNTAMSTLTSFLSGEYKIHITKKYKKRSIRSIISFVFNVPVTNLESTDFSTSFTAYDNFKLLNNSSIFTNNPINNINFQGFQVTPISCLVKLIFRANIYFQDGFIPPNAASPISTAISSNQFSELNLVLFDSTSNEINRNKYLLKNNLEDLFIEFIVYFVANTNNYHFEYKYTGDPVNINAGIENIVHEDCYFSVEQVLDSDK